MLLEGYTRSNRRSAMSVGNVLVGVWCRPGFLLSEVSQEFLQRTTDNAETDLHLYTNASPDSARAVRVDFDPRYGLVQVRYNVRWAPFTHASFSTVFARLLQPGHGARSKHRV